MNGNSDDLKFTTLTEERIICGEIILMKTTWSIQFQCEHCQTTIRNLELFLRHSLEHLYDNAEADIKHKWAKFLTTNATEQEPLKSHNVKELEFVLPDADPLAHIKTEEIHIIDTCDNDHSTAAFETDSAINQDEYVAPRHMEPASDTTYPNEVSENGMPNDGNWVTELLDIENTSRALAVERRNKQKPRFGNHLQQHGIAKRHKCDLCEACFKDRTSLNVHRRRHLRIQPHQCEQCDKRFTTITELKYHIRSHTGERPFVCKICASAYPTSSALSLHKQRHTDIRSHECGECDKKFNTKEGLKAHIACHSKVRPFICEICNSSFKSKKALGTHHSRKHPVLFHHKCTFCDKAFKQQHNLGIHIKDVHENFKLIKF